MHLAVSDGGLDAHDREAGENTGLHGLLDTGLDGADEFGGDVAAGDLILELEGLALGGVERLEVHQDLCELAGTTGLLLVRVFLVHDGLADRLAVCNLRVTDVALHLEFTTHTVDDDVELQLAHAGDQGLAGLFVGLHLEGRILVGQLRQSDAHLLLVGLGLRLHGHLDHRIREGHGFEGDRGLLVAQGITGGDVLQTHEGVDVAGFGGIHRVLLVGVHLEDLADAFLLLLGGVEDGVARLDGTGVHAHEHELAVERVGGDLEDQCGERIIGGRLAVDLDGLVLRVEADDGRNVLRARQVVDDGVQHRLHTLVLEGGAAEHRVGLTVDGELADAGADLVLGQFAGLEVLLKQLLVGLGDLVEQLGTILLSLVLQVGRDVGGVVVGTQIAGNVVPDVGLHADKVDDAGEVVLSADRQLDDQRGRAQLGLDGVDGVVEVSAELIHLVDEADTRNAVLVSLTPHGLGLRLHAFLAIEHGDSTIEHTQGALHLGREVHVARGIDDVDLELLLLVMGLTVPEAGGSSGLNGDAALLLLSHEVHRRGAIVGLADLVVLTGVEQNTLGGSGLTGIDVSHDADVTDLVEIIEHV